MSMNDNGSGCERDQTLRMRAEERAMGMGAPEPASMGPEETRRLLHELRVHQIELEMQNEELRRAQEELEASRARYVDLYDFAPVGYFTLSHKSLIVEVNLTAAALLGVVRSSLLKQPLTRFILPEDQDIYYRHRQILFETGAPQVCEMRLLRPDSPPFWAHLEAAVAQDAEGAPICRCAMSDIAQQKRAEEERIRLEAQVHEAQKMESIGRLAGGVAHDFNNMLSIILGYGETVLDRLDASDPLRRDVREILDAGKRSAALTRQLLAYARKQVITPRVLDLNDTIEDMLKMLRRLIGEDIDLVWLAGHGLWPVKMDPTQVDQVLANLLVNARDAIAGVGQVTIRTQNLVLDAEHCANHAGAVPGDFVMLAVTDDGCGMDREVLDHLFEPFFTTKEVGKGTGMGLPTVYGIVKQNNGLIDVKSEPGRGTTVAIYLPGIGQKAEEWREAADGEAPRGRGEIVLLVEDEAALLGMLRTMLEGFGYRVLTAGTPEEAIGLAAEPSGEIQLLLTDVVMPQMDGQTLASRLRETRPDLRCLFMSGYTADIIAKRGVVEKNVHFIQKPFTLNELAREVREALGGEK